MLKYTLIAFGILFALWLIAALRKPSSAVKFQQALNRDTEVSPKDVHQVMEEHVSNEKLVSWGACPDVLVTLRERIYPRQDSNGNDALNEFELTIAAVYDLFSEVNNGGFHQWLFNSSGDLASKAAASLHRIGDHNVAALADRACAAFGAEGPVSDCEERRKQMLELSESAHKKIELCDDEYPDLEPLMLEQLYHYAFAHINEVRMP